MTYRPMGFVRTMRMYMEHDPVVFLSCVLGGIGELHQHARTRALRRAVAPHATQRSPAPLRTAPRLALAPELLRSLRDPPTITLPSALLVVRSIRRRHRALHLRRRRPEGGGQRYQLRLPHQARVPVQVEAGGGGILCSVLLFADATFIHMANINRPLHLYWQTAPQAQNEAGPSLCPQRGLGVGRPGAGTRPRCVSRCPGRVVYCRRTRTRRAGR